MAIRLSDPAIQELSVVFGNFNGKEYAPRNEEARVLSVKADQKGKLAQAFETLKAYFASNNDLAAVQPFPVTQADDDIDNDGDGPEDYNQIVSALCGVYNDISQACCIQDDGARSAAIVAAIQAFLTGLDALRADADAEKAGARHSAADKAHLDALQAAHAKAKAAVDEMGEHLAALQPQDADKATDKKPYGDVAYADPKNGKYPIDKAAWSYINQDKNAAAYSADELAAVKDKIRAACEKFGIDISSKAAQPSQPTETDMTPDELNALVADAAAKAAEAAVAKANEAAQVKIDAAKAEAQVQIDAANAAAEAAKAQAVADAEIAKAAELAAKAEADELKAAALKAARTPSGGSTQAVAASSSLQAAVKAALAGAGSSVI